MSTRLVQLLLAGLTISLASCVMAIDKDDDDDDDGDDSGLSIGDDGDTDGDGDTDSDGDTDGGGDTDTDPGGGVELVTLYTAFGGRVTPTSGGYRFEAADLDGAEIESYFYVILASENWDGDLQNNEEACVLYFTPTAGNVTIQDFSQPEQTPSSAWVGFVLDGSAYAGNSGGACASTDADAYGTSITWGFGFGELDSGLQEYFESDWAEYPTYADNMVGGWMYLDTGSEAFAYNTNYGFAYELSGGAFVVDSAGDYSFWDVSSWSDIEEDTYLQITPAYGLPL